MVSAKHVALSGVKFSMSKTSIKTFWTPLSFWRKYDLILTKTNVIYLPRYNMLSLVTSLFSWLGLNFWAMCFSCICREAKWVWWWFGFWKTFSNSWDFSFWRFWGLFWSRKYFWDPMMPLRSRGEGIWLVFIDLTSWITRDVGETENICIRSFHQDWVV